MSILSAFTRWLAGCALAALATAAAAQDSPFCCPEKPPIRPIDRSCLPAGKPGPLPLYRSDVSAKYQEVANVDSFIATDNCTDTIKLQLNDLQAKGKVIGADALVKVRPLTNKVRGFQENPDTPFFSLKQGESNDYFYRATAIKYLEPVVGEPQAVAVRNVTDPLLGKKNDESADPFNTNKLFRRKERGERKVTLPEAISTNPGSF